MIPPKTKILGMAENIGKAEGVQFHWQTAGGNDREFHASCPGGPCWMNGP